MRNLSVRTWVLIGFVISITGIFLNVPIVAELNNKIRDVETELTDIKESLRTQANEISRADLEDGLFTILNHISKSQTGEERKNSGEDAVLIRQSFLQRVYAAANEIPASDVLKAEIEQMSGDVKFIEKYLEAGKAREAGNTAEADRLFKEGEALEKEAAEPKSELGKKLKEAVKTADPDKLADKTTNEIILATIPALKSANETFLASFAKKEAKIKELNERKEYLSWWSNVLTYLAVSLQLFGLLCVLQKDLPVQEIKDNVAEVKDDTKEVLSELQNVKEESQEAKDLLAELEEDLKSAIEKVDKNK
ncbi:MAG: hypothetical protein K1X72_08820 [Pyrinomonadaceae bacterium]|nr:hypothetical protein [Pyrinomonadaceae bacterium]